MPDAPRTNRPIRTYTEFWPYYLQEHAKPATRRLHFFGTGLALAAVLAAVVTQHGWLAVLALFAGYGPAWFAHFFVEKNRPATFTYPWWSLVSDFRMAWRWATGHLEADLHKAGVGR